MLYRSLDSSVTFLQESLRAACLIEATARKPGNVHPEAGFPDLTYEHFCLSADRIVELVPLVSRSVGEAVLRVIQRTREIAPSNPNLGIVLLLAPLAAVPLDQSLSEGIGTVLDQLTVEDAQFVYEAIRLARPGGLGKAPEQDIEEVPTGTLLEVMRLAADRDRIACQYANRFHDVLQIGVPLLLEWPDFANRWEEATINLQLHLLATFPDSLIARKCGPEGAAEASRRARELLDGGWPDQSASHLMLERFDAWLRADGNRRNPGTTADLVAACLFAALRERLLPVPEWAKLGKDEG
ncbi:MAG: triphosphoribosyl-dephospho-CoA synthase [Planctomycetales bacterium]